MLQYQKLLRYGKINIGGVANMTQFRKGRLAFMILAITLVIVLFHVSYHYALLRDRISLLWGEPQKIDEVSLEDQIFLENLDEMKYIKLTQDGDVFVYKISDEGKILDDTMEKSKILNYDKSIFKYDVQYLAGSIYYIKNDNLYKANILDQKDLIEPEIVTKDLVEKFNLYKNDEVYIGYLSGNEIKILDKNSKELSSMSFENKPINFDFVMRDSAIELYTIEPDNYRHDAVNLYSDKLEESGGYKKIDEIDILAGDKVYRLDALANDSATYISYSKLSKKESSNIGDFYLKKINPETLSYHELKLLNGENSRIDRLNKDYKIAIYDSKIHVFLAALDLENDLSKFSDIVDLTINQNLKIENYEMTSTTYEYSRISDVIETESGSYLLIKELNTGSYDVKINSNGPKYMAQKEIPKESIKGAIMQGMLSPMYSIMHIFINTIKVVIFMIAPAALMAVIFTKKRIVDEKLKFRLLYGCFSLIFIYDFKTTYMGYNTLKHAPDLLKNGYMGILVPAIILIIGLGLVNYYTKKIHEEADYVESLVVGIMTSIYIATLMYAPLGYIKIIMTQG
jgi:hypothetical protein